MFPCRDSASSKTNVKIFPFRGGMITLPEKFFINPASEDGKTTVPSLSFLIEHPNPPDCPIVRNIRKDKPFATPFRFFFDLGLRSSPEKYAAPINKHLENRRPFDLSPGVAKTLSNGHIRAEDIDAIIFSHVHYDHHGDPENFPCSTFFVGYGAMSVLRQDLGSTASHQYFEPNLLPAERSFELPDPSVPHIRDGFFAGQEWQQLGPFPRALDLFNDGSVYVIDTPGHLPGHVNLLCRTGSKQWYYLAGDAAHDVRLLSGERDIGTWRDEQGQNVCIHHDIAEAKKSIERIKELLKLESICTTVIIAHDPVWAHQNQSSFYPRHL